MAKPSRELIDALRVTADRLASGDRYQWSHMGSCNCGHLAQTLTRFSPEEIHASALLRTGDWSEQVVDYCPTSGFTIDRIFDAMMAIGMRAEDIQHLERLSDHSVLRRLPVDERHLKHNRRNAVVRYMREWAALLEAQLAAHPKSGQPGSLADRRHSDRNPTLAPAQEPPRREPVPV